MDEQKSPEVSDETKKLMNAVKQLVNVYDLLNTGSFQGNFTKRVLEAQEFIKALHSNATKDFQERPDFKEAMLEVSNGQKAD